MIRLKKKTVLCIFLAAFQLLSSFGAYASNEDKLINVIERRIAKASSEQDSRHGAQMANDGINDNEEHTYWKSGSDDKNPSWQTDMGVEYQICKIKFEARKGAPDSEKSNFEIIASNDENFENYSVLLSRKNAIEGEVLEENIAADGLYRYIMARKTDGEPFSIAEISVFADSEKIAQGAEQGKLYDYSYYDSDETRRYITPSDVMGTKYEKAVSLLCQLNLMRGYEDGTFKPEKRMTRAEFAAVAANLLGLGASGAESVFEDVSDGHWAKESIAVCVQNGVLKGVSKTEFEPETLITSQQVITIMIRMLGYEIRAEQNGGYPSGYRMMAASLGLLGCIENGENITRGEVAVLISKALEADLMEQTVFGTDGGISVVEGDNLLKNYHNIIKSKGIVNSSGYTALTKNHNSLSKKYIEIGGEKYITDIPDTDRFLGMNVEFWYNTAEDKPYKTVAILPAALNDEKIISSEDDPYFKNNTLYYYKNDKLQSGIKISSDIDFIYNGAAYLSDYNLADFMPESGEIRLIDNDGDGKYNVIIITNEKTYAVKWVSETERKIYVHGSTSPVSLDLDNDAISIINGATGENVKLKNIKENNILSVAESKNSAGIKIINIILSDKTVEGTITQKGKDYAAIDGVKYSIAKCLDADSLEISEDGVFYLDYKGKIAYYDGSDSSGGKYGFLRGVKENKGVDTSLEFRIFTEDGEFISLKAADNLKIDEIKFTENNLALNHLKNQGMSGTVSQLIKYKSNSKNQVLKIDTTYQNAEKEDSNALKKDYNAESRYYMNSGIIGMIFACDEKTVLMRVPENLSDEEDYEILPPNYMENSTQYTFEAYDGGEDGIEKLLLFAETGSTELPNRAKLFVVDEVSKMLNDNGETKNCVSGVYDGNYVTFSEYTDGLLEGLDLKFGDITAVELNSKNQIKRMEKRFYNGEKPSGAPARAISTGEPQYGGPYSDIYYAYGYISNRKSAFATAELNHATGSTYSKIMINLKAENLKIYVIDNDNDEIRTGNESDVSDAATVGAAQASRVFLSGNEGNIKEMVVFK